ncbi:MAG: hypothetical protein HDT28_01710 [Clostridiales bacterium]|nr:hypothetical protein [Clostridiales bacterium]
MKKSKIAAVLAVASTFVCPIALVGCGDGHDHTFDTTKWEQTEDGLGHYNPATCEHTDERGNYAAHVYDDINDATCNVCDYVRELGGVTDPNVELGTLSGTVTAYGKNLNGVTVAVGTNTTVTGATGKYSLGNVGITDSVTVTFSKDGYRTETKTVAKSAWTDKKSTLDVDMHLATETATVSGTVKAGGVAVSGATVKLGELTPVTTGADGAYSFEVSSGTAATLTLTVTHPTYETHTESIAITVGATAITKNVSLSVKTISELGDLSLIGLNALTAEPAADYDFRPTEKGGNGQGSWTVPTSSYNMSNEGILFHEAGQNIESGSKELKLYAYNRFTFDAIEEITVRARRFPDADHNANLLGGGYPEVYILLVGEDGTVITPKEAPGEVVSTNDDCSVLKFTLKAPITGKYVFAVGTTRGNRAAIESVQFRGVEVTGNITGTIMQNGAALEGATVTFGDGDPVTTGAGGTFTIPVSVRKGGTEKITVSKNGVAMDITFTATDLASGTYNIGEKELKALPLPGITLEQLDELSATAAENVECIKENEPNKTADEKKDSAAAMMNGWIKVGGSQDKATEGWLLRDAGNAPQGTSELKVFVYRKLTFTDLKAIVIKARTFVGQNDSGVQPEIILKLIDSQGNSVKINHNVALADVDARSDFYFTLDEAISGDYVLAIGVARSKVFALAGMSYLGSTDLVENTVTGTVKYGGAAVSGATVSYNLGYNVKVEAQTGNDGTFTLPISRLNNGSVTLNVQYDNGTESASKTVTYESTEFTNTTFNAGDIALSKTYLPGLTSDDIESLQALTGTKFESKAIYDNWQHDSTGVTKTFNEGSGFERASGKTDAAYYYAKFAITDSNKFMKGNWFIFNRGDEGPDQDALLQVKVITADGNMVVLPASKVFCGGRNVAATSYDAANKNLIVNNIGAYTEGVYDFSAYVGQTITIIIQEVTTEVNKRLVTVSNEIAFQGTNFYAAGTVSGIVKDASGNPLAGVSVSAGGSSATTNASGEYSVDVAMNYGNSVTVTFAKVGYVASSITVSGAEIEAANGEKTADDVTLVAAKTVKEVIEENMDSLTALNGTTFGPADNGGASGWTKSSAYNVNRDICIPLGEYIYAKVNIDDSHKYMKFNARDTDNQGSKMLVMVYVDGELVELAPWRVYGTTDAVIEGNYLINNRGDGYNEGIYDFSAYSGKEIIIVIQTAACLDGKTSAYTQCNEIAFGSVKEFDKAGNNNYYEAPAQSNE